MNQAFVNAMREVINRLPGLIYENEQIQQGFSKNHLLWMLEEIASNKIESDKKNRWIGWLQCALVSRGVSSLEEMKQISTLLKAQPLLCPDSIGGDIDPDFEDDLDRIRKWPISENYQPLFDHIISNVWKHNFGKATASDEEYGQIEYTFATGGWSENEEILAALKEQRLAWSLTWLMSERGGRHVFRIVQNKSC